MILPTHAALARVSPLLLQGMVLHPNPRLYKFRWRVFTSASCLEGEEFLARVERLSTAACAALLTELRAAEVPYLLYPVRHPRRHEGMPFDPQHERWRNADWAPPFEMDEDPEWQGYR